MTEIHPGKQSGGEGLGWQGRTTIRGCACGEVGPGREHERFPENAARKVEPTPKIPPALQLQAARRNDDRHTFAVGGAAPCVRS